MPQEAPPLARIAHGAKGTSLVAAQDIAAGTTVTIFAGPLVPFAAIPEAEIRHVLWFDAERWMIPEAPARYMNHSCEPNCLLRDRPGDPDRCDVVALRAIVAGEELTISYDLVDAEEWFAHRDDPAYGFWHPSWSFDCLCGSPRCRGRIDRYVLTGDVEGARRRHGSQPKA